MHESLSMQSGSKVPTSSTRSSTMTAAAHPALLRPGGSKFRLLPCPLPLPAVDARFEGWLASRWYPLVSCTALAGILVVFVDPTRHSRLDVSLRISCVIKMNYAEQLLRLIFV